MALRFDKERLADADIGDKFLLGDVIDVSQLVTRHELKKRGIDLAALPLEATNRFRTSALVANVPTPAGKAAGYKPYLVYLPEAIKNWDAEDFYVMMAHETAHITQPSAKLVAGEAAMAAGTVEHKDDPTELDAQIWESRQATRFGWDDERYQLYVDRLYTAVGRATFGPEFDITGIAPEDIERLGREERRFLQTVREEAEERPASFATMRRRVSVRGHVRRRVVNHLENPPRSCLCHRSKRVDRVRRRLVRRLGR